MDICFHFSLTGSSICEQSGQEKRKPLKIKIGRRGLRSDMFSEEEEKEEKEEKEKENEEAGIEDTIGSNDDDSKIDLSQKSKTQHDSFSLIFPHY